jgi:type I restriction enzyme S subunit
MMVLNDICNVITCGVAKRPEYIEKGVPFLSSKNVKSDRFILNAYNHVSKEDYLSLTKNNKPEVDDILYTRVGSFGEAAVIDLDFDFAIFVSLTLLKPKKDIVLPRYLMHYLNSPRIKHLAKNSTSGVGVQNLNVKVVRQFPINLPPLEQQKKIAAILDAADTYRQKTKALITKYDALTQSLFLDMFGDPVRNPKGWTMKPLKEFGKIVTGNTPSRKNDANFNDKFIEWIKTNNITSAFTNVTTAKEYLSEEGLLNSRSVNEGSLLVACIAGSINSIGRAALTDRKVAFNQQINAIEPFRNISSTFLYYLFKSSSGYIQSHASNGMKRMLSKGDFQKIKMICPDIDIQNQFADSVKAIEVQKTQAQASLAQAENLFNSLLQRAFKGELV